MNQQQYETCPVCLGVGFFPIPTMSFGMLPCLECGGTGKVKKGL